jgi:dTDP-4-dehydrorhamnose reductase
MKHKNRKKLLITGISGLLGSNLAYYFKDSYDILGLHNTHPVKVNGIHTQKADIISVDSLKIVIQDFQPDIIIHCASLTDIEYCEVNRQETYVVNILGTKNIVDSVQDGNTRIIYLSSDSVYEGAAGDYSETDPVNPQNYYGLSKYKGELEVLKRVNSLIIRTNIFGWNIQAKHSIAEWVLHELTQNNQINGFKDVYFSSIYTLDLAVILEKAIEQGLVGIYNCGSSDTVSKYEFALLIARLFRLNQNLVNPISINDYKFKATRGKNLSLNVSKLALALNRNLPRINDSVKVFYNDFKAGLNKKIGKQML